MARAAGYELRMYEVVTRADTQPPKNFVHRPEHEAQTLTRLREQPEELQTADGAPFATAYRHSGTTRLRLIWPLGMIRRGDKAVPATRRPTA